MEGTISKKGWQLVLQTVNAGDCITSESKLAAAPHVQTRQVHCSGAYYLLLELLNPLCVAITSWNSNPVTGLVTSGTWTASTGTIAAWLNFRYRYYDFEWCLH